MAELNITQDQRSTTMRIALALGINPDEATSLSVEHCGGNDVMITWESRKVMTVDEFHERVKGI
jgi:hypothetical protein